ncbi:hypothetical protein P5704_024630 (plasmid) [Pseudomonas sp. FeN3W]|nr:hypothetical protein P5704_024630 [Pseudomonas sp. FeN3W]
MASELIDEARYLANRNDFLKLLKRVYADQNVAELVHNLNLILVGGQALAVWHYQYFSTSNPMDVHYSFSDDVDFFGLKLSLEFLRKKLNVHIKTPEDFEPTVNLGIFTIPSIYNDNGYILVDIIESVGGLEVAEIKNGTEIVTIDDFDLPLINPLLCLKSRIHNFFAPYKSDKLKELYRIDIAARCCKAFIREELDRGWTSEISKMVETVFGICKSIKGCELYLKHKIDVMEAIDFTHPNFHKSFIEKRFPRALMEIQEKRAKREAHLKRFGNFNVYSKNELNLSKAAIRFNKLTENNGSHPKPDFNQTISPTEVIYFNKEIGDGFEP